ncbi:hypothetical protein D3C84_812320 [compost metagenome]
MRLSNQPSRQIIEGLRRAFYSTRKREIENYQCPDLVRQEAGVGFVFTDTCNAKKIIGDAVGMHPDDVSDCFWPQMTAEQILQCSNIKTMMKNALSLKS